MPPSQVKPLHTMLPTNPCIHECQVYPNGPYHCHAGSKHTLCHPSALVLFAPTPNSPPPSQIMPPMKPHLLQTTPSQFAVSAPEDTSTHFLLFFAQPSTPGMTNLKPSSNTSTKCFKSKTQELSYAVCGNRTMAVMKNPTSCMCAGHVDHSHTEPAHALLQLITPNIVTTDLVVSFFPFLSYQINLWQSRCLYASLFFSHYAACTPHFIHLRAVHGYVLLFFASILPPPCGHIMFTFSSIPWPCLMHAPTSCY